MRDGLAPLHAGGKEWDRRVLGGSERGQQIVLLEDEPKIFPAKEDALLRPEAFDVFPEKFDLAARTVEQAGDHRKERRLSAPARSDEESRLAEAHVEINAP
jgi:hypothetical protein